MNDSADLAVIGAGPAGLAAGATAAGLGLKVLLLDEQAEPGGQVWRQAERILAGPDTGNLAASYGGAEDAVTALRRSDLDYRPGAAVFDVSPELHVSWLEREAEARPPRYRIREGRAKTLILATGAMERPLPFPGWTLPGVMGVGALQTALKVGGLRPAPDSLVLAGQGPLMLLYLAQVLALGVRPAAILDLAPPGRLADALSSLPGALLGDPRLMARGIGLLLRRALSRIPVYRRVTHLQAVGGADLQSVRFESRGRSQEIPCSLLGVHDGVIPATQLSRLLRLEHRWRDGQGCFEPVTDDDGGSSDERIWIAGDGGGIEGVALAGLRGRLAALKAAERLGRLSTADCERHAAPLRARRARQARARRFLDRFYAPVPLESHIDEMTPVCRCEGVTLGTIRAAVAQGADGPNRVKTFTRCGMGPCQGRFCGPSLVRVIAAETGRAPAEIGALRIRPPLKPILLGDYLDEEAGA
ncbi:FAD-dependent oxidoreductase [Pelagibius sp.]|uniref:FAD-dependent oxidoreductase n=1 Tax=Pelagibius sp. TaxID=1931238 RepID=UPI003B514D8D